MKPANIPPIFQPNLSRSRCNLSSLPPSDSSKLGRKSRASGSFYRGFSRLFEKLRSVVSFLQHVDGWLYPLGKREILHAGLIRGRTRDIRFVTEPIPSRMTTRRNYYFDNSLELAWARGSERLFPQQRERAVRMGGNVTVHTVQVQLIRRNKRAVQILLWSSSLLVQRN